MQDPRAMRLPVAPLNQRKLVVMSHQHSKYGRSIILWYHRDPTLIFSHSQLRMYPLAALVRPVCDAAIPASFGYHLFAFYTEITEISCARPPQ